MAQMKLIPADNMKDKLWGKRGTPEREAMETKLKEDVNAYIVGEAIRKARLAQNLTQEQLGERIGVQRAQISKLEKGTSVITLPTMSRVFQALGIATATHTWLISLEWAAQHQHIPYPHSSQIRYDSSLGNFGQLADFSKGAVCVGAVSEVGCRPWRDSIKKSVPNLVKIVL